MWCADRPQVIANVLSSIVVDFGIGYQVALAFIRTPRRCQMPATIPFQCVEFLWPFPFYGAHALSGSAFEYGGLLYMHTAMCCRCICLSTFCCPVPPLSSEHALIATNAASARIHTVTAVAVTAGSVTIVSPGAVPSLATSVDRPLLLICPVYVVIAGPCTARCRAVVR